MTTYNLPAHTLVRVTIYQFDSQTGLRNEFISQAQGTVGGNFVLDGKPTQTIGPTTASHVFAIPQIGLSVPLEGIPDNAKNPCSNAPCALSYDHTTTSFTFRTPGRGSTAGSASCRARRGSSRAGAGRCRRSATWTASSRSHERRR